ncbi:hypothetical protein [Catellatospora tritici]|uniref:hypothetical protein n=1 Tax=Catellatospora tritici TaxID=2851566 RepID=UPI001C2D3274|nr:hypothetical protein [Catellatospora tritici]MBV1855814.1 hypothetical protein [Catellatospora tritici]
MPQPTAEQLVRAILARHAPAELDHFEPVTALLFANPAAMYTSRDGESGPLGADLGQVVVVLTPVLYAVLNDLAKEMGAEAVAKVRILVREKYGLYLRRNEPMRGAANAQMAERVLATLTRRLGGRLSAEDLAGIADDLCEQLTDHT